MSRKRLLALTVLTMAFLYAGVTGTQAKVELVGEGGCCLSGEMCEGELICCAEWCTLYTQGVCRVAQEPRGCPPPG